MGFETTHLKTQAFHSEMWTSLTILAFNKTPEFHLYIWSPSTDTLYPITNLRIVALSYNHLTQLQRNALQFPDAVGVRVDIWSNNISHVELYAITGFLQLVQFHFEFFFLPSYSCMYYGMSNPLTGAMAKHFWAWVPKMAKTKFKHSQSAIQCFLKGY